MGQIVIAGDVVENRQRNGPQIIKGFLVKLFSKSFRRTPPFLKKGDARKLPFFINGLF
ncbi:hypothetical protein [Komagataeibacter nataicola]|uniref:hypothetical protein n=1 Tax=Komagataeibacter nataicola TaxID=265960 RepID=UPI0014289255|nr:hypothetical protein [Komagataeibacter nataicola]